MQINLANNFESAHFQSRRPVSLTPGEPGRVATGKDFFSLPPRELGHPIVQLFRKLFNIQMVF
jgi:hypothetical protein